MNGRPDMLDDRLREFYDAQSLDPREVAELLAAVEMEAGASRAGPAADVPRRRLLRIAAAAALLVAVAAVALAVRALLPPLSGPSWDGRAAAEEIVRHHVQDLAPEFLTASIAELGPLMPRLGFVPSDPHALRAEGLTVVGGRYCSLGTIPALQARLLDSAGRTCTLYVLRWDAALPQRDVEEHLLGDVRVRLWREGELVFALAQPR